VASAARVAVVAGPVRWGDRPSTIIETSSPEIFWGAVASREMDRTKLLILCAESPDAVQKKYGISGADFRWISPVEGERRFLPGDIDHMGIAIEDHYHKGKGRFVAIQGIERVVRRAGAESAARLLEVSRDVASETGGALIVELDPAGVKPEELLLLEKEGTVLRG